MSNETKKVLIVDDEPLIRLSAVDVAQDAGFEALSAASREQALAMLSETGDIDILFTDIRMAGEADGLELAATVREKWPNVAIVLTSGHVNDIDEDDGMLFLSKPYVPEELARILKDACS